MNRARLFAAAPGALAPVAGNPDNLLEWAEAQGIQIADWQGNMIRNMYRPMTDQEYLLDRLNQQLRGEDPGPYEHDRMMR